MKTKTIHDVISDVKIQLLDLVMDYVNPENLIIANQHTDNLLSTLKEVMERREQDAYEIGYDTGVRESVKASLNLIPHHIDVHAMFKVPTNIAAISNRYGSQQ